MKAVAAGICGVDLHRWKRRIVLRLITVRGSTGRRSSRWPVARGWCVGDAGCKL